MRDDHLQILQTFNLNGMKDWLKKYSQEQFVVLTPKGESDWLIVVKTSSELKPGEEVIDSVENFLKFLDSHQL